LVGAIIVWIIGRWVISALIRVLSKTLDKRNVDPSLKPFLKGTARTLLIVLLLISVLSMLGVQMTAFVAVIGAIGLAVGLALSGTLQNFAGGVIILLFKPFKVGDLVEAQGYKGTVSEIQIFNTILKTPDNKTVVIPNGGLSTSSLVNYSVEPKRRVDWTFGIGYGDNTEQATDLLRKLLNADSRILDDPQEPFIAVSELADSSVNFTVRAWVNADDYWGVHFDMNRKVYNAFNEEGLSIPYPQMDLHVHKVNS
jgi:small conductance mechanosensitive channel